MFITDSRHSHGPDEMHDDGRRISERDDITTISRNEFFTIICASIQKRKGRKGPGKLIDTGRELTFHS
jgi:hypothetical protein